MYLSKTRVDYMGFICELSARVLIQYCSRIDRHYLTLNKR